MSTDDTFPAYQELLQSARDNLVQARMALEGDFGNEAARMIFRAVMQAAQAYSAARGAKPGSTPQDIEAQFNDLVKTERGSRLEVHAGLLRAAIHLKADYDRESAPTSSPDLERIAAVLGSAARFVEEAGLGVRG